ncbi:MAG: hypothetical protein MUF51_03985 [Vicinamibacteria bacterium]|nr:hypothetical protein [Vicinamibacteria bacterium]
MTDLNDLTQNRDSKKGVAMRRQMVSLFVVLALVFSQMPVWAQATSGKSDLAAGIRQVEEGDFEVAAGTLDKAIKAMAGDRPRRISIWPSPTWA